MIKGSSVAGVLEFSDTCSYSYKYSSLFAEEERLEADRRIAGESEEEEEVIVENRVNKLSYTMLWK